MSVVFQPYLDLDRPPAVGTAVTLLYISLTVGFLIFAVQIAVSLPAYAASDSLRYLVAYVLVTILLYAVMLFVTTRIAKGQNWARWLFLAGFVIAFCSSVLNTGSLLSGNPWIGIVTLSDGLIQGIAAALLFQRSSSAWFLGAKAEASAAGVTTPVATPDQLAGGS